MTRVFVTAVVMGLVFGLGTVQSVEAADTLVLSGKSDSQELEIRATSFGVPGPVDSYVLVQVPSGPAFSWNGSVFSLAFDGANVLAGGLTKFRSGAPLGAESALTGGELVFKASLPPNLAPGPYTFYALLVQPASSPLVQSNWLSNLAIGRAYVLNIGGGRLVIPPTGSSGSLFIHAGRLVTDTSSLGPRCLLQLDIQNLESRTIILGLTFNAFDSDGAGIGSGGASFMLGAGSTSTYPFAFVAFNASRFLSCPEISRIALSGSVVLDGRE